MARPIATTRRVERDELLAFLRPRHRGILVWGPISTGGFPPEVAAD